MKKTNSANRPMFSKSFFALTLSLISLSGCATAPVKPLWGPDAPYVLEPGDVLRITVYGDDQLSGQYTIDPSGHISMPLARRVVASKKTVDELEDALNHVLSPKYIRDASVSIDVVEYSGVFVLGEVRTPGKYPYVPNMSVMQAVAVAGGYTYRASESGADVTRLQKNGELKSIDLKANEMLHPGDTVYIGRRWF